MVNILFYISLVIGFLLAVSILVQAPKYESLGNAFQGEKKHVTKAEKTMITTTYTLAFILFGILYLIKFLK